MKKSFLLLVLALSFTQCGTNLNEAPVADIAKLQISDFYTTGIIVDDDYSIIDRWKGMNDIKSATDTDAEQAELLKKLYMAQLPGISVILGQLEEDNYFTAYYVKENTVIAQLDIIILQNDNGDTNIEYTNIITGVKSYLSIDKQGNLLPVDSIKSGGQNTMDCITDAYTNHGWISVWAWVQSAFIPETAVAIAAGCALINL